MLQGPVSILYIFFVGTIFVRSPLLMHHLSHHLRQRIPRPFNQMSMTTTIPLESGDPLEANWDFLIASKYKTPKESEGSSVKHLMHHKTSFFISPLPDDTWPFFASITPGVCFQKPRGCWRCTIAWDDPRSGDSIILLVTIRIPKLHHQSIFTIRPPI